MVCVLVVNIIQNVIVFSSDLLSAILPNQDTVQGIRRVSGLCTPRTVGESSANDEAVEPSSTGSPPNRVLSLLNTNISTSNSFCFLVTARTNPANTNPFFRIFNSTGLQIGSLTATRNGVTLTLFSSTVTFNSDFTGTNFRQFQICVENNRASLYDGCAQVGGTQPFSTTGFSSRSAELRMPAAYTLFQDLAGQGLYQVRVVCDTVYNV